MTSRTILPAKDVTETIEAIFNFQDQMPFGTTISGAAVTASVFTGVDPNPMAIINGVPALVAGFNIKQEITAGVAGVIYLLVCSVAVSGGLVLTKEAYLSVIQADQMF